MEDQFLKKPLFSNAFFILVNHRNAENSREKSWQDVPVNVSEYPQQKKQWHKDLLFIYWGFQVVLNFMFAISISIDNILQLYNFYEWKCL